MYSFLSHVAEEEPEREEGEEKEEKEHINEHEQRPTKRRKTDV